MILLSQDVSIAMRYVLQSRLATPRNRCPLYHFGTPDLKAKGATELSESIITYVSSPVLLAVQIIEDLPEFLLTVLRFVNQGQGQDLRNSVLQEALNEPIKVIVQLLHLPVTT